MHDTLYELCEVIEREMQEAAKKIRNAGGKINAGDADYIDKLTHSLKSLKTVIAMAEAEDDYSNAGGMSYARRGRRGGNNRDGMSYARREQRRDSMGRHSRESGYSYDDAKEDMMSELREIMEDAPDERTKREFHSFMQKLESM